MRLAPGTEDFSATGVSSATMLALVDDRDAVAQAVGLIHVMRGEKERAALLARADA